MRPSRNVAWQNLEEARRRAIAGEPDPFRVVHTIALERLGCVVCGRIVERGARIAVLGHLVRHEECRPPQVAQSKERP